MPSTACWWLLGSEGKHCECLGCDLSTPDVTSGSKKTSGGLSGLSYKPGGKNLPQGVEIPWLCLCCAAGNEGLGAGPFMVLKNEMVSGQLRFWGGNGNFWAGGQRGTFAASETPEKFQSREILEAEKKLKVKPAESRAGSKTSPAGSGL